MDILIVIYPSKIDAVSPINTHIIIYLARASRMVQHFHGELSGLTIEQKEELQRSSDCIRDCHQYLDISDIQSETGLVRQIHRSKQNKISFFFIYLRNLLVILIDQCGFYVQMQLNHMKNY